MWLRPWRAHQFWRPLHHRHPSSSLQHPPPARRHLRHQPAVRSLAMAPKPAAIHQSRRAPAARWQCLVWSIWISSPRARRAGCRRAAQHFVAGDGTLPPPRRAEFESEPAIARFGASSSARMYRVGSVERPRLQAPAPSSKLQAPIRVARQDALGSFPGQGDVDQQLSRSTYDVPSVGLPMMPLDDPAELLPSSSLGATTAYKAASVYVHGCT